MSEFASTAMMRVILRGMQDLSLIESPDKFFGKLANRSTVNLLSKRELLKEAIGLGGMECLIKLGGSVRFFKEEPTFQALTSTGSPLELFLRWQKLERYIHSSHRVVIVGANDNTIELKHLSKNKLEQPLLPESLVVAGVLAGLLSCLNVEGIRIYFSGVEVYPKEGNVEKLLKALNDNHTSWQFTWDGTFKPRDVIPNSSFALYEGEQWPGLVKEVSAIACKDLMLPKTLEDVATTMSLNVRTLQRQLRDLDFSYRDIVGKARCNKAAWYLLDSMISLSEIGYLTGFSDQSHFTREFKNQVGLTPMNYRKIFKRNDGKFSN